MNKRLAKAPLSLKLGILLVALLTSTAKAKEGTPFEDYLPADTRVFLQVHDIAELNAKLKEHPLEALIKDDEVKVFFKPLIENIEKEFTFEEESEFDIEQLKESFNGQAVLAVFGGTDLEAEEPDTVQLALMMEYKGERAFLEKLNEDEDETEEFLGETIYYSKKEEEASEEALNPAWALIDGTFILTSTVEVLRELIPQVKDPLDFPSLSDSTAFIEAVDKAEKNDLFLFFNLQFLTPDLLEAFQATENAEPSFNFLGVTPQTIVNALALEVLQSAFLSVAFDDDQTSISGGLLYTEERGLTDLISFKKEDLSPPGFIPPNVHSATLSNLNVEKTFHNLEAIIAEVSPFLVGIYQLQLEQLQTQTGIDFKENIIYNLGNPLSFYSVHATQENKAHGSDNLSDNQVLAFPLKDPKGMEITIETIKDLYQSGKELFDERDYLGTKIFILKQGTQASEPGYPSPTIFAYAITERYLFINSGSNTALLEETLSNLKNPGKTLWTRPDIEDALQLLPEDPVAYEFYDVGVLFDTLLGHISLAQQALLDDFNVSDPNALPPKNLFPSILVSGTYTDSQSLTFRSILLEQKNSPK